MPPTIEAFFQQYADAYCQYQTDQLLQMFSLPCMLLTDSSKHVILEQQMGRSLLERLFKAYQQLQMDHLRHEITSMVKLSDSLYFVSVQGRFYLADNRLLLQCHTSYTLQKQSDGWKIVAVVMDDEEQELQRLGIMLEPVL
ncbi:hypothetical protein WG68_07255 [Arsukibacterium ikkense]|uniref:SnoaL-like domain-containing protein n=1 Tax=Arsukibacterium ikkense TaxID=336831 RepID=A0A0M2V5M2_9GAMM|nr:ketosteroid isomerase family protein [Arsukibacterium ikkense]KKO46142.1 hypothetical protein WG68_07255 [Arsukibacterium ikkense]